MDWGSTMPEWFDRVAQEWSLIGAAPISFAIALAVVVVFVWAILYCFYRRMLSSKDIQIELLQTRLADYRNVLEGASPREAAYRITRLKGELAAIKGVPRDENAIYQKGKRIGESAATSVASSTNFSSSCSKNTGPRRWVKGTSRKSIQYAL